MIIQLRGRRYRLRFQRKPKKDGAECFGYCDHPNLKGKSIVVEEKLGDAKELEVLIHEMLHACLWDLDEEAIDETAHDIARALGRLGYRRN